MSEPNETKRGRGRPRKPKKQQIHPWLPPELVRDLDVLELVIRPKPTQSSLVEDAVRDYVEQQLKNETTRKRYEAEIHKFEQKPKLA